MSVIPLGFEGDSIEALVIGGGRVGTRRALSLLEAGARVRVIAPAISAEPDAESHRSERLTLERREYLGAEDIGDAMLIVAATATPSVNEQVAPVTIGVSAGSVPNAAGRIRDSIAERIDSRYAEAVAQCGELRHRLLAAAGADGWRKVAADLIDERFCESVEQGTFAERAARWL